MSISFREIANLMDPVESAKSIRGLAAMHRWPAGTAPSPLLLRRVLDRHRHPRKVTQRFLFYNTFLLFAVKLSVKDYMVDVVCPDIPIPILGGAAEALCEEGLRTVLTIIPDGTIRIGAKPALQARAREIGKVLAREYDIAALCEQFSEDERRLILAAWPRDRKPETAVGPDDSGSFVVQSSGLFTISSRFPITRAKRHTFKERGDRYRDTDTWANKGMLLTEIDLGFERGKLEVYSTHLFNGNDMPVDLPDIDELGLDSDLSATERVRVQLKQVDEVVEFMKQNHSPANVTLLVGDFNIDAHSTSKFEIDSVRGTPYSHLERKLGTIGLEDLWKTRNNTIGFTSSLAGEGGKGRKICAVDQRDPRYCDDLRRPEASTARIDYIFVEKQKPGHAFVVDFTRPRRVPFERGPDAEDRDEIAFMSDHLGLEVTLIATPA